MSDESSNLQWNDCQGYRLLIHDGRPFDPMTLFDFEAVDSKDSSTRYVHTTRHSDLAIKKKIVHTIADLWPDRKFEVLVDKKRIIRDIRLL